MTRPLIDAVIGLDPDRYPTLYQTSPEFHAAIDTVAKIAPNVVQIIADSAEQETEHRRLAAEALRQTSEELVSMTRHCKHCGLHVDSRERHWPGCPAANCQRCHGEGVLEDDDLKPCPRCTAPD